MKKITQCITSLAVVFPLALLAESSPATDATLLTGASLSQTIKALPARSAVDQPLHIVDVGSANVGLFVVHRPQEPDQGCTIERDTFVTDKTTSILRVIDGAGTIVTGGRLVRPTSIGSLDPDIKLVGSGSRGGGIQNGRSRRISKGDLMIIPAGVPHGFSAIEKSITYEVIRIDSGKTISLK